MYKSLLYVPASRDDFIAKAASRNADAIILDLEDSVAPNEKIKSRDKLGVNIPLCAAEGADIWVRINRPLRLAIPDMEAAIRNGAKGILLTKAESAEHIRLMSETASEIEREIGRADKLLIIAMIESPGAIELAPSIAKADPRVIGLLVGSEDLATAMGGKPTPEMLRTPKLLVHIAAKAAGINSFGLLGTVADYNNVELIKQLIIEARIHGIDGATCVHPSIVPLLNAGFAPSPAEIDEARRIVEGDRDHKAKGIGAFALDGRMIDEPVVQRALNLLERAGRSTKG